MNVPEADGPQFTQEFRQELVRVNDNLMMAGQSMRAVLDRMDALRKTNRDSIHLDANCGPSSTRRNVRAAGFLVDESALRPHNRNHLETMIRVLKNALQEVEGALHTIEKKDQ